jgi:hypothetical protein
VAPSPRFVPTIVDTVQVIATPFAETQFAPVSLGEAPTASAIPWTALLVSVWIAGSLAILALRIRGWLTIRAAVRASAPVALPGVDPRVNVRAT